MIIIKAPLRISFVGGGSDLPDFYYHSPGKVLSATINKYVYVVINPAPLLKGITARYAITENVDVSELQNLKNDRMRESLLELGIKDNMEIGIFSDLPVGTGLGGSSSFTVALIKGLATYLDNRFDKKDIAETACKIEIDLINDPIGKQDQYAATFGGFNIFQFNPDDSVNVEPLLLGYQRLLELENSILLFFTGITRQSSSVLLDQRSHISSNIDTIKYMVNLVDDFQEKLSIGDIKSLGNLLQDNWLKKKQLSSKVSNQVIDELYSSGLDAGAWGGKVLGAGGGGCIMFLAPTSKFEQIRKSLQKKALSLKLEDFKEIPIKFVQSGVEVIFNNYRQNEKLLNNLSSAKVENINISQTVYEKA